VEASSASASATREQLKKLDALSLSAYCRSPLPECPRPVKVGAIVERPTWCPSRTSIQSWDNAPAPHSAKATLCGFEFSFLLHSSETVLHNVGPEAEWLNVGVQAACPLMA
jgi:hypothetical protein